jgi:predicted dehydrogenase
MEHGKHVAIEVPSAETLEACWDLVNTSERTRRHCMILENCCYDFFELTALTMAQAGLFGEIIHAEGAYNHNLDPFWKAYWNNWRLDFNSKYRGDLYPTHGFGPVCQVLNIHRGDRLTTLVAMDTNPFNGPKHAKAAGMDGKSFQEGDVTMTMLRTEKGKSILIEHDVMTPRPYSRMYQLVGTDGYAEKYPVQGVCLREEGADNVDYQNLGGEKTYRGAALEELMARYPNPILTPELEATAKEVGGHGGMDFIMDYRLVYCLNNGLPLDMDVYDLAEWCCVTELSRISLENGSAPVAVPDFTRGAWNKVNGFSYAFAK